MNTVPTPESMAEAAQPVSAAPLRQLGHWHLVTPLSQGERADVYTARPASSGPNEPCEYVAKILGDSLIEDPTALTLFRREVCVGGKVSHGHLAPVVDAELDEPPYFLIMPRIAGTTLDQLLAATGPIGWDRACWIVRQVAQALDYLHGEGWLHGDVKPSNILVAGDGHVTLLDLGFLQPLGAVRAELCNEPESKSNRTCLLGTLDYLAPESLTRVGAVAAAGDIYSLGLVLYETLAGRHPFAHMTEAELVNAHCHRLPGDICEIEPAIPERLADLLPALLAKDPLRRLPSAADVVRRLVNLEITALGQQKAVA